jgi:L-2-hydroxyglutarate oxidase LhgO
VRELEPNVLVHSALLSPNTGIADFGAVSRKIADEIDAQSGSDVKVQFEVRAMNLVTG